LNTTVGDEAEKQNMAVGWMSNISAQAVTPGPTEHCLAPKRVD